MPAKSAGTWNDAVDAYINKSKPFALPILTHLRELVHAAVPDVEEAIKWSMPFFLYKGIILSNMAAFKGHCSFRIWKENAQSLMKDSVAERGSGMGNLGKLQSLDDLPPDKDLKKLLAQAAKKIASGDRTKNWEGRAKKPRTEVEVPEALATALKKNKTAAKNFDGMSQSCRREYCEWITEAKREETRDKRVATAVEWISEGKSRNWKYEKC